MKKREICCSYCVLFLSNVAGMILEMAASRVMSPFFGNTFFVWTTVIAIIILAGCIGNLIGGKLSWRKQRRRILIVLMGGAAVAVGAIPVGSSSVLDALRNSSLDMKSASLLASFLLFVVPATMLGVITPVLSNDLVRERPDGSAGSESGKIHAVVGLGGLIGTLAGGFWLIPAFGTNVILTFLSVALLLLPLLLLPDWNRRVVIAMLLIAGLVCGFAYVTIRRHTQQSTWITEDAHLDGGFSIDTQYGRILIQDTVEDGTRVRHYRHSSAYESATFLDEELKYELYYPYLFQYDRMFDYCDVKSALMLGGAAFQYPEYYISHFENCTMDVVEIDPVSIELARRYFFLDDLFEEYDLETTNRLGIITADARVYLNETDKKYDAILNDAFTGEVPAPSLTTVEAATLIRDHLNPGGIYLCNVDGSLDREQDHFLGSELLTLLTVFSNVYLVPAIPDCDGSEYTNYMIIASEHALPVTDSLECSVVEEDLVLTDAYNPVEQMYEPMR